MAVDGFDMFLDNMKVNEKGEIWIGGPVIRDQLSYYADHNPWIRAVTSRLPFWLFKYLTNNSQFGGVKITFNENTNSFTK